MVEKAVRVWQYVVDIFTAQNANNIKWFWCLHEPSVDVSTYEWNDIINHWPGDEYVDLLVRAGVKELIRHKNSHSNTKSICRLPDTRCFT